MKHSDRFAKFLATTVNLNQSRLDDLDSRVAAIVRHLKASRALDGMITTSIPQGSWAQRTIIRPLPGDEFDADILLRLRDVRDWSQHPRKYLSAVTAAFTESGRYATLVQKKNRCVRVHYASLCHVDIVPYVIRGIYPFESKRIVNWDGDCFEPADPDRLTGWMRRQDGRAKGNLRKSIRLFKYLRDRRDDFSVPSIILTTLLGNRVNWWGELLDQYADLPSTFASLTSGLDSWLQAHNSLPTINDPSGSGASFSHRWSQRSFGRFRDHVHGLSPRVRSALGEKDSLQSAKLWQQIFGPEF